MGEFFSGLFARLGVGVVSVLLVPLEDERVFALFGDAGLYEMLGWIGLFIAMSLLLGALLEVLVGKRRDSPGLSGRPQRCGTSGAGPSGKGVGSTEERGVRVA